MKKFKVLLLLLLVILTTGCGSRRAATPDQFKDAFKDYTIEDVSSEFAFADTAYKVTSTDNMIVYYFKCKSVDVVKDIYYDEITNVTKEAAADLIANNGADYKYKEEDIEKTITKGENFTVAKYSLRDTYYRISFIEDTYIYGTVDIGQKTKLDNLMISLKY